MQTVQIVAHKVDKEIFDHTLTEVIEILYDVFGLNVNTVMGMEDVSSSNSILSARPVDVEKTP